MSTALVSDANRTAPDLHALDILGRIAASLAGDPRFSQDTVTRPHPLILCVQRNESYAIIAPARVWDRGRDILKPFSHRFAEGSALLILLGRPEESDLSQAMNLGLASLLPEEPSSEELYVAVQRSLDLLEARDRAERRGKWLRRYR
jgi:hypothetical protein